jgi:hypothetical protein
MATKGSYKLVCTLNEAQAQALGTFIRRIGWNDIKNVSTDEHQLIQMLSAIDVLRECLARGGYPLGYPIERRARKR